MNNDKGKLVSSIDSLGPCLQVLFSLVGPVPRNLHLQYAWILFLCSSHQRTQLVQASGSGMIRSWVWKYCIGNIVGGIIIALDGDRWELYLW